MCVKKRQHIDWPRQVVSEPTTRSKVERAPKKRTNIVAKFLPQGWRFLRPREEVRKTDFFWSYNQKCYFPSTTAGGQLAGVTVPFIRRIGDD